MSPEEIAKLITEDPDVMENLRAVSLGPSQKAQSRKRKRRLEKMKKRNQKHRDFEDDKDQYKVDKVSGQPKSGQILYSDVNEDNPSDITEARNFPTRHLDKIRQAITGAGNAMREVMNNPWNHGESGSFKAKVSLVNGYKERAKSIAGTLRDNGYTHANTQKGKGSICTFLVDHERFLETLEDATLAANSKGPSPIAFPRGEWWGQFNWTSAASRKKYLDIFAGEVLTRFLGMVELERDDHAQKCHSPLCKSVNHADYVAREILCNGKVSLWKVYEHFNRERADIINTRKSTTKKKKKKEPDYGMAKGDPLHTRLVNFERALLDQFGQRYINSGMPRVPIVVPRGVDLKDYARQYLQIAHVYFGDDVDIDTMWRQAK